MENIDIRCHRSFASRRYEFYMFVTEGQPNAPTSIKAVSGLKTQKYDNGSVGPVAFRLREDEAQVLMDSLWSAGIRPTEGSGSAGAMAKVESHLKDMRTIAFKKLGISE